MPLSIIIIGAGIAGLSTAIALRRAGHTVQIFEKSHFATEIGAAVSLAPNGVLVLHALGFDFARANACRHNVWEIKDGLTLDTIKLQNLEDIARITGSDYWTVHRVDMHKELLRLALEPEPDGTPPVQIHYGAPVRDIDPVHGRVYLANTVHQADLVIGADGIRSAVRACVVPDSSRAVPTGLSAFRFLLPSEVLQDRPHILSAMKARRGDSTLLADTTAPERHQHMIWYGCRGTSAEFCWDYFCANIKPVQLVALTLLHDGMLTTTDPKQDMLQEFGHFNPIIHELIQLSDDVTRWPLLIHEPLETRLYHKVLLVGDAAHAMLPFSGQGATQAIEDAGAISILFQDLSSAEDLPARLALFEKVRTKRASRIQVVSKVRVGKEEEIAEELKRYLEDGMVVPDSMASRLVHDSGFNVLEICAKELEATRS